MAFRSLLTVVTPATSRALTTVDQAAEESGVDVNDMTDAADLVAAASEAIVAYTGREWVHEAVRETFRGSGGGVTALILERAPVTAITAVSVDGVALNLATEVEYDQRRGLLFRLDMDSHVAWGGRVVIVDYAGGYVSPGQAAATMPKLVQRAAAKIVAGWHQGLGRDPRLRSQTIEDVGAKSYIDPGADDHGLPPGIAGILEPLRWRRPG